MQRESRIWLNLFGLNSKSSQKYTNVALDKHHSGIKVASVKRKRAKARVVGKTFFPLLAMLLHLPSAYAEEASILEDAKVTETYLDDKELKPGSNLVGKGFKSGVVFSSEEPFDNGSAEFQIILEQMSSIRTAMILNSSENHSGERYSIGSAEIRVGTDRTAMSLENKLVASGIFDSGFHEFESPTLGDVVNFRRVGRDPHWKIFSWLYLNEIRLYETVNLLKE